MATEVVIPFSFLCKAKRSAADLSLNSAMIKRSSPRHTFETVMKMCGFKVNIYANDAFLYFSATRVHKSHAQGPALFVLTAY